MKKNLILAFFLSMAQFLSAQKIDYKKTSFPQTVRKSQK